MNCQQFFKSAECSNRTAANEFLQFRDSRDAGSGENVNQPMDFFDEFEMVSGSDTPGTKTQSAPAAS
jgi:hypothetical protein